VFQVNCPGCFIYGFPRQQAALEVSSVRLECPGTLNGFEDFEYNTAANTELLLTEMKLVGATRQALENYSQAIDFPVAVDHLTTGAALATPENTEALTETIPDFDRLPKSEQAALRQR